MRTTRSRRLFRRARNLMPGGVSSPVRAFGFVGGTPRFIERASGPRIQDADGNRYIDYVCSWGAIIVGHAHPVIVEATRAATAQGSSFGAPTELELDLAERLIEQVPSLEMVRFVNSGTEATMSALRLARGATGRARIVKFEGGYHGHADALLASAGSGVATLGIPGSAGVPEGAVADTVVAPYNDLEAVHQVFHRMSGEIAAVIVEPIAANMGLVLPEEGFLEGLRELCDDHGAVLIFDEVITGFRVGLGGAQGRLGVIPDLTCLGKVIGGGLPVGAYGGSRSLMERVAPAGEIYQAGTLSGNPLAMAAGRATLEILEREALFDELELLGTRLVDGLRELAGEAGLPLTAECRGGLFGLHFHAGPVRTYADVTKADHERYRNFFRAMLEQGIYLAPSPFEAGFLTLAHGEAEIDETLEAAHRAFRKAG
ncbi:MAG: glutamate-1-semialdehyde 2,1-aminomutase [Myxococcota bacterium]